MDSKPIIPLITVFLVETVHAAPAYEAGQVIFEPHSATAVTMAGLQFVLGVTTFLYQRKLVTTSPKHRKKMDLICFVAVLYLALATLIEVGVITFGSPFSPESTRFVAHCSVFSSILLIVHMWEKLNMKQNRNNRKP